MEWVEEQARAIRGGRGVKVPPGRRAFSPEALAIRAESLIVCRFYDKIAGLAQLVEQWNHNPRVIGPSPIPGTSLPKGASLRGWRLFLFSRGAPGRRHSANRGEGDKSPSREAASTRAERRRWETERLKEYIIKGFTLDDQRLKNLGGGSH